MCVYWVHVFVCMAVSVAWCGSAVAPLLTHWSCCSLALGHRYMYAICICTCMYADSGVWHVHVYVNTCALPILIIMYPACYCHPMTWLKSCPLTHWNIKKCNFKVQLALSIILRNLNNHNLDETMEECDMQWPSALASLDRVPWCPMELMSSVS